MHRLLAVFDTKTWKWLSRINWYRCSWFER